MRPSKRAHDELRKVSFERGVARYAEGSCLVSFGETHVLCAASLEDKPPPWLRGQGRGWVTAEYAMLPRATSTRTRRESTAGKVSGRTQEIQRLIGRTLRAIVDLPKLGERQISIDCDVIQADGGTRTAAITGAWIALNDCLKWMVQRSILKDNPMREPVAAISCGIHQGEAVLDLDYAEDSNAETDANFVITGSGGLVEVQGEAAEGAPFSEAQLLVAAAHAGARRRHEGRWRCRRRRSPERPVGFNSRFAFKTLFNPSPPSSWERGPRARRLGLPLPAKVGGGLGRGSATSPHNPKLNCCASNPSLDPGPQERMRDGHRHRGGEFPVRMAPLRAWRAASVAAKPACASFSRVRHGRPGYRGCAAWARQPIIMSSERARAGTRDRRSRRRQMPASSWISRRTACSIVSPGSRRNRRGTNTSPWGSGSGDRAGNCRHRPPA